MKKLLVVLLAAMMVLSVAAVSMAAVTVKGDFRYEIIANSEKEDDDALIDNPDFRLDFDGDVSESLSAHLRLRFKQDGKTATDVAKDFYADEYWFKFNQGWGTITVGNWDWKDTPSRVLVKSNGNNILPRSQSTVAVDIPFESGLYVGAAYVIDKATDGKVGDGAYGLKVGYKADSFGAEVTTEDYGLDDGSSVLAYDLYYQINDDMKVYLYARDPKTDASDDPEVENIIGFLYKNIAGSNVQASLEYGIDPNAAKDINGDEWNQIGLQVIVPFSNGLSLEFEHTNFLGETSKEEETKDVFRFRAKI